MRLGRPGVESFQRGFAPYALTIAVAEGDTIYADGYLVPTQILTNYGTLNGIRPPKGVDEKPQCLREFFQATYISRLIYKFKT